MLNSERKEIIKIVTYQNNIKRGFFKIHNRMFQTYGNNTNGNANIMCACMPMYVHTPIYTYIHYFVGRQEKAKDLDYK